MDVIQKDPRFYRLVRPIISLFMKVCYRPTIIGKENIPQDKSVVLAGNHTNNFDCLLLIASTKRTIRFLAKDELYKGIKKPIFKHMGIITVNRRRKDRESLQTAISFLKSGKVIGIFPEGTFNRSSEVILPFKIGAVKMAHETDSPIIPFVIKGKYRLFKKGLKIIFFKPMKMKDECLDNDNQILMDFISDKLKDNNI